MNSPGAEQRIFAEIQASDHANLLDCLLRRLAVIGGDEGDVEVVVLGQFRGEHIEINFGAAEVFVLV